MFAGFGSAEKTIITALHLTGRALTVDEVTEAFPQIHAKTIRRAAFSLEAKGAVRLSDGRPMLICSARQTMPQQAHSGQMTSQQPRCAALETSAIPSASQCAEDFSKRCASSQQSAAVLTTAPEPSALSPADAYAAKIKADVERQKQELSRPVATVV